MSFPGALAQGRLGDVFPPSVAVVLGYRDGEWVTAIREEGGPWRGLLEQVEAGYGYWVHSIDACPVDAMLDPLEDCRPPLCEGWNLVGCVDRHLQPAGDYTGDLLTLDEYLIGLRWWCAFTFQGGETGLWSEVRPNDGVSVRCASAFWVFIGDAEPTDPPPDFSWVYESDVGSRMGG